jgi:hypothetical protein
MRSFASCATIPCEAMMIRLRSRESTSFPGSKPRENWCEDDRRLRGELRQRAGGLDVVGYSLKIIDADLQEIEDGFA